MAKGERTRARTVEKFLDVGLAVFADRGFHAASMDEICTRAALSRGAFYSNFSGKEALFFALFDRHAENQVGRITAVIDGADSLDAAIAGAARAAAADDPDERRWALLSTEFTIYAARDAEAARRLTDRDVVLRERLSAALARFIEPHDAAALARYAIALYEGAQLTHLVDRDSAAARELLLRFLPAGLHTVGG
ncbi:TetR/AcrR family transcriptional regulator [Tsukamurella ocularis]|uniref:TetR/AcrR family transcriptional regulator n=1 Tax=Tsukamurella ocularis TaxID=1970234 RepID=UPI002169032C|nr:TetR/AcrR family transcriptional regulator [Tsukamurella ocularis]MCS3779060.1 AcrR family transcriptional regulator [Tsukamurella ocularis]MCS3787320.1 AcrR family transcriptional regulator [Tsukamurella ocularis]MCS3851743.1 AcrR family transcriptional regulator [Tsukamurella ocularis]